MTDHDVAVATPPDDTSEQRPERSLAEQLVDQARADGKNLVGPGGLLSDLTKQVLETGLEVEMEEHLGYAKHAVEGRNHGNSRNGTRSKTVITEIGPIELDVPRDRDGSFEPETVRKNQRRLDGVDSMVISLTAKGLTTGEVEAHLAEVYSTNISRETISKITDRVLGELADWQNRPLDRVYPVIFIDAIVVKIRDGQVANRPVYAAIGVTVDGQRDILGLWIGTGGEGAKYWLQVLTEIKNRGVDDACIVVCDGLKGLPESIEATWPLAIVQTSLVHNDTARNGSGCHPHRRERASADRPSRSRRRPVPPVGDGLRTASRSCAASAITSDGGGLSTRVSESRRRRSCPRSLASIGVPPIIKSPRLMTTALRCSTSDTITPSMGSTG
jgi:hypothetical protein